VTPEFDLVNNLFGWGDPGNPQRRGIWFVGIEEFDRWGTAEHVNQFFKKRQVVDNFVVEEVIPQDQRFPDSTGQVANFTSKIVCSFSPEIQRMFPGVLESHEQQEKAWRRYRETLLWYSGTGVCNANLFPLGKRLSKDPLPEHSKTLFGFGPKDMEAYKQHVRKARFPRMRERWEACSPQATICYVDQSRKEEVQALFWGYRAGDEVAPVWQNLPLDILCNNVKRILISPHFSYGRMSDDRARVLIEQLKAWRTVLPK
jgi:hypothetical protein